MSPRFDPQSFQEWKSHPLTAIFRQYLKDQHQDLKDRWGAGQEMSPIQQSKALLMMELATLEWPDVAGFYGIELTDEHAEAR